MVLCECYKETCLYCCTHNIPVCGDCVCLPQHCSCEVRTYAEGVIDTSCTLPAKCSLCLQLLNPTDDSVTRLGCLHVLHTSCLLLVLKGASSATGYACPSCKSQIWLTKQHIVSSGSTLANQLEELFEKSYILMLDKSTMLPLAPGISSNLSKFANKGFSEPRSATTVFSISKPVAEMYKNPTKQKVQLNYIPSDEDLLKCGETSPAPSIMIDIEDPKFCSPEIVTAESMGSPKHGRVFSRKFSFRGEKKNNDFPVEESERVSMCIPNGPETEHAGTLLPHSSHDKPLLPITSPTYNTASKSLGIQDSTDGRWRRYRRTAIIGPRKILLFFATLSSMGTMLLIYFTLQSENLVKFLYS